MDGQNQNRDLPSGHNELSHDQAVSLRSGAPGAAAPAVAAQRADYGAPAQSPSPAADAPAPAAAEPQQQPIQQFAAATPAAQAVGPYAMDNDVPVAPALPAHAIDPNDHGQVEVSWSASEFIAHDKNMSWYAILAAATIVFVILAYLFTRDWVAVVAILASAGMFAYMAGRQPRQLEYNLTTTGIAVGPKFYSFAKFRSYSIVREGAFASIDFMPLKRFDIPLSVYYDPQHEDHVIEVLSRHLPIDEHKRTMLDGLMHRIRF